jgi:hypothetical protein
MSDKPVSRQREQQRRLQAEGRCIVCWTPLRENEKCRCDGCRIKLRERSRKKTGNKPWREGFAGRPPKEVLLSRQSSCTKGEGQSG